MTLREASLYEPNTFVTRTEWVKENRGLCVAIVGGNYVFFKDGFQSNTMGTNSSSFKYDDFIYCDVFGQPLNSSQGYAMVVSKNVKTVVFVKYREAGTATSRPSTIYNSKEYGFLLPEDMEEPIVGDLVVVNDTYGFSLVKVVRLEHDVPLDMAIGWRPLVDLNEVNKENRLAAEKAKLQKEIKEGLTAQIEEQAMAALMAKSPDLAAKIKAYKDMGGSYAEILPSKNMLAALPCEQD